MCLMRAEADTETRSREGGFTLLEILVSVAVLAIVLSLVFKAFDTTAETVRQVSARGDRYHLVRVIYSRLSEELIAADWEKGNRRTVFVGLDGTQGVRPAGMLRFSSRAHVRTEPEVPESDLNLLVYELRGGTLLRREERNPLSLSDRSVETDALARGVTEFSLRYWDGSAWRESWDAAALQDLPSAVRIELAFQDAAGDRQRFVTMVTLPRARSAGSVSPP